MAGELMAKVGWIRDTAEWGSLIEGRPHAIRGESAVAVMLATNEQTGALRWEAAGDRAFYGYATESTIAPATTATVIDPADDPTPDDWGTDPDPDPTPPSAEHAFTELRKGDTVRRCTEPGCNRIHRARGLCDLHYARAKAAGTLPPVGAKPKVVGERPRVVTPAKNPNRIAYGAAAAPARPKPGITAESLGYAAGAPIRWPEDWTTTPDPELGRIAAAALARCSGDKREARKYLGAGQPAFDRALKIARDLGLA